MGTDSHTTMINGLGVLGWGVGGIEAEAAMLGQPVSMLLPQVVGFRLEGELPEGSTATDLVLTVTQALRERGVVGRFVEFFGPGLASLPLADRATIGNMAPEYGATCGIFPIDAETLRYLEFSGRSPAQVALVEGYAKEQGLFHDPDTEQAAYSDTLELDLSSVVPSLAGPKRPQDRIALAEAARDFVAELAEQATTASATTRTPIRRATPFPQATRPSTRPRSRCPSQPAHRHASVVEAPSKRPPSVSLDGEEFELEDGAVVIAAITSCTNTSNPTVMVGVGPARQEGGRARAAAAARGSRRASPRVRRWSPTTSTAPASPSRWRSSASTSWATAAPPASATRARCRRRSPPPSRPPTSRSARCSPAIATSRGASIPR